MNFHLTFLINTFILSCILIFSGVYLFKAVLRSVDIKSDHITGI